jgi:ATP-dependent RNA helicase RhlE
MFSQLGLSRTACASLARLGYETPTPIQTDAIPLALKGVDLLARAQTGTGKTAAFGLPMIERLLTRHTDAFRRTPRGLVLVPTRELAVQVHQTLSTYAASTPLRVAAIVGGAAMSGQLHMLRRGVDIVVATPGRLLDHLQRRTLDLSAIEVLTLDEADRMLDMGFLPALRDIVAVLPGRRQTLLFSATLPDAIIRLSAEFSRDAVRVDVSTRQVVPTTVTHQVHHVASEGKREALTRLLAQPGAGQALVFCRTKRGANRVGEDLGQRGVRTGVLHGDKSQGARNRALDDFKTGRVRVLVATDLAARGLDIANLPLVVNFDLPLVAEDYVHRVGRTGRAGQHGRAVSLVSASETRLLRQIQQVIPAPLERVAVPAGVMVEASPVTESTSGNGVSNATGAKVRFADPARGWRASVRTTPRQDPSRSSRRPSPHRGTFRRS